MTAYNLSHLLIYYIEFPKIKIFFIHLQIYVYLTHTIATVSSNTHLSTNSNDYYWIKLFSNKHELNELCNWDLDKIKKLNENIQINDIRLFSILQLIITFTSGERINNFT